MCVSASVSVILMESEYKTETQNQRNVYDYKEFQSLGISTFINSNKILSRIVFLTLITNFRIPNICHKVENLI